MSKFKFFNVLLIMITALFCYSCDIEELLNKEDEEELENNESIEFYEQDFIVVDNAEDWDKGIYFANGNQFFVNFHEGTQKVKQQMAFVTTEGQLTPVYVEMDVNEFPYFIVCGDTWIHITDYNEQTMDFVINKADKYMALGREVEHNIEIGARSRGWRENNFVRNVIGVTSMVIGGAEVVLGSIATVGGAVTEAPTGGLSTAVIAGGILSTLGGVGDFSNGWDMIMNYDNKVFTQEQADKLADLSYSQLKKNLENGMSAEDATMNILDQMFEIQDAYQEGDVKNGEELKKLPLNKKLGLAKALLGIMDHLFGKTRTEYQMLCEFYCNLFVVTEHAHNVTEESACVDGWFYIPSVQGLENMEYATGAVVYEKENPNNRWNIEKPTYIAENSYHYKVEGLKENTEYEFFVYFLDKTHMLHRFGDTQYFYTKENMEKNILVSFYKDTNGDGWKNNTNWCSDKPLSEWYGIQVNEKGRVVSINLSGNNLTSITTEEGYSNEPALYDLPCLTFLNLDNNLLSGLILENCGNLDNVTFNNCFHGKGALRHDLFNVKVIGGTSIGGVNCNEVSTSLVVKNITMTGEIDYHQGLESLTVEGCDFGERSILWGNFNTVNITNTKANSVDGNAVNCTINGGYFHHCGVNADHLSFINSTTYDTWYAHANKTMKLVNSHCAVICGGDFEESCSITVSGTYLDRPNWHDDDSGTYNFSCSGSNWYKMFEND